MKDTYALEHNAHGIVGISKISSYQDDNGRWSRKPVTHFRFPQDFLEDLDYIEKLKHKFRSDYWSDFKQLFLKAVHDIARFRDTNDIIE